MIDNCHRKRQSAVSNQTFEVLGLLSLFQYYVISLPVEQDDVTLSCAYFVPYSFYELHPVIVRDLATAQKFHSITEIGDWVDS